MKYKAFQIKPDSPAKKELIIDLCKIMKFDLKRVEFIKDILRRNSSNIHIRLGEVGYYGYIGMYRDIGWRYTRYELPEIIVTDSNES